MRIVGIFSAKPLNAGGYVQDPNTNATDNDVEINGWKTDFTLA